MKSTNSIAASSIVALLMIAVIGGCGEQPLPPGGSIVQILTDDITISAGAGATTVPVTFRVATEFNAPLNGMKATINGGFAYPFLPSLYYFCADYNCTTVLPSNAEVTTNDFGQYTFFVRIPDIVPMQVAAPTISSAVSTTFAGTLVPGTYSYVVTALSASGAETNGTAFAITTGGTNTSGITITWAPVAGAAQYAVYGRTAGAEDYLFTTALTSWLDDGSITPLAGVSPPPTNNTQGTLMENDFTDTVYIRSGGAVDTIKLTYQ